MRKTLDYCLQVLRQVGIDQFQCALEQTEQLELNLEGFDFTLNRTTFEQELSITVLKGGRKGEVVVNCWEPVMIDQGIATALELLSTAEVDLEYDVAAKQSPQNFASGPLNPEPKRMYELLKELTAQIKGEFPLIRLMETRLMHKVTVQHFVNSNGVDFCSTKGSYDFSTMFSAKDGKRTTSLNCARFTLADLEQPLLDCASLRSLLQSSLEHLQARAWKGKFTGDLVIVPDCLLGFIEHYVNVFLSERALLGGTSPFKNKLGEAVAHSKFNLCSLPLSPDLASGYVITTDGYVAQNTVFIKNGILNNFLLSQYGAQKTGFKQVCNSGGLWVVGKGEKSFKELVGQVERGILLGRYSGGWPSPNGDFSGVAKNSYYIENGKLLYPITETMIAGNLGDLFWNTKGLSAERVNFGLGMLPFLQTGGITISGK